MNTTMPNSTTWNIQRRTEFSRLKEGTELPGYCGYIEQYKYHVGDTYGNSTRKLSESVRTRRRLQPPDQYFDSDGTNGIDGPNRVHEAWGAPRKLNVPKAMGDNKLTENMVPGYQGFIPRRNFIFGNTYKVECDVCIDEFEQKKEVSDAKMQELWKTQTKNTKLTALEVSEEVMTKRITQYRDHHPTLKCPKSRRTLTEAPPPGYMGYIPMRIVTEHGLGGRFGYVAGKSLNAFHDETQKHSERIKRAYVPGKTTHADDPRESQAMSREDHDMLMQRRIYKQIGMLPKYTGYLPNIRFQFGNTYGDTSRSLPACAHDQPSYGRHLLQQSA